MNAAKASKICRICCNQKSNDLVSLIDAENKTIVKKLRACADVTIEHDDLLPKYICKKCLQNLSAAYSFKIQCEYMDQKFRESIMSSVQQHSNLNTKVDNYYTSYDDEFSDLTDSFELDSGQTTMGDVNTLIQDGYERPNLSMNNAFGALIPPNQNNPVANMQLMTFSKQNLEVSAMDISPRPVDMEKIDSFGSTSSTKEHDECTDHEMLSLKSEHISSPKIKRQFKCEMCDATFSVLSDFHQHKLIHDRNRFQCKSCNRWFDKKYKLNEHSKTHSAKVFECSSCTKRFSTQTNLDRHIRIFHKKFLPHTCITCKKTFAQLTTLRLHQSVHMNEREFSCDTCDSKFGSEVQLKLHKKRHLLTQHIKRKRSPSKIPMAPKKIYKSTTKPCVCSECGKLFGNIALLRSHMQCHSAEKKYECNVCKKRFSFQSTLRNHIYLHTGEKRFKCDVCQVSFRQIGLLQGHKLIHSGIKPHICTHCGKAFALRSNLTVHLRTHTGTTPYHCNICPKKFGDSIGLKRHLSMHQRKNQTNLVIEEILEAPTIKDTAAQTPTPQTTVHALENDEPFRKMPFSESNFDNVTAFNAVNPNTIQIIEPFEAPDNAKDFIFQIE